MSEALARSGANVTGIDIAPGAISAALSRAHSESLSIDYRLADAQRLPYDEGSFDAAVCTDVLVHVPDPRAVISEMVRVVKPGGDIFFSAINRGWFANFVMVTLGEDILRLVPRGTHDPGKFIRPGELKCWLNEHGAAPIHSQGIGPIGWSSGLVFGRYPISAVMYQGHARKQIAVEYTSSK